MDKKAGLKIFKITSSVFTLIVIALFILAIHSSLLDPLVNQQMFIELPSEDEIEWTLEEDYLTIKADIWMENGGYYELQDIDIDFNLSGWNETLFSDSVSVDRLATGERASIPVTFSIDQVSLDDEQMEEFVFNSTDFNINSRMRARYPFSLVRLEMIYEDIFHWDGFVQQLEFIHDQASVRSLEDRDGSVLELPFEVETNEMLTGTAEVDVTMYDENMEREYSTDSFTVHLGGFSSVLLSFQLTEELTEEFITNSQRVKFVSDILFSDANMDVEHRTYHDWGAPLDQLSVDQVRRVGEQVQGDLYFRNDSPRDLLIELDIHVYDDDDLRIGDKNRQITLSPGETFQDTVTVEIVGIPTYAIIDFYEHNTGMEHQTEEAVDDL